ncbi:MAG: voltage-gated sodium channel [Lentimonas sp.]|jgi:voltage-gated sodium channel
MSEYDMIRLISRSKVAAWRLSLARWVESAGVQNFIIVVILLNAIVLGLETDSQILERFGPALLLLDKLCLIVFIAEIGIKLLAYRMVFWRNGWNWFDFFVVAIALAPGTGPWAVLRTLRILRVLRLLTVVPQLRQVVAAFIHAIPGLSGVILVMAIFFYTMGVLATNLFSQAFPQWFGSIGASLYSLFQIMTLESWSMGIVRPVMEIFPWAWAYFIPFIVIATFTILNLFIGIIVSTMQELASMPDPSVPDADLKRTLERMENDLATLRAHIDRQNDSDPS